ncbi:MAG TPA: thioredoxin [Acidimicrobiales bacterium]
MATIQLTAQNFEETASSAKVMLIDFWASWCGPCRSFAPTFEKVSERFPDIVFAKVDTEAEQALAGSFNIMSIPTLIVVREQFVLYSQAGALPESALVDLIEQALRIDMELLRRESETSLNGTDASATRA